MSREILMNSYDITLERIEYYVWKNRKNIFEIPKMCI